MSLLPRIALLSLAFYLGATIALALPYTSPLAGPLSFGAHLLCAVLGVRI